MTEKGETKIIAIFTICIMLISVGLSGCVEEDEVGGNAVTVEDDLSDYDFNLELEMTDNSYPNFINITITLTNLDDTTIELETYRISYPGINLTDLNGTNFQLFHGNITVAPNFKTLTKNDKIQKKFDLTKYSYFSPSGYPGVLRFKSGIYKCQVFAYSLESNIVKIEIK